MAETKTLLQKIPLEAARVAGLELYMLRLDLMDRHISGNKHYKLRYNLERAAQEQKKTLVTAGGAWSNHIAATAAAGREAGFQTVGVIRGEALSNPTLSFARSCGMELQFVSRELYRDKHALQQKMNQLAEKHEGFVIPEGGANKDGIRGCMEIVNEIQAPFDIICCPCGTGTTLAGIILSLEDQQQAIGFQVLKGEGYMKSALTELLRDYPAAAKKNWSIDEDFHFGGYAKSGAELQQFIRDFESACHIPLDHVYTGKMMFGLLRRIRQKAFRPGSRIVAVHTGGLQGTPGFYGEEELT